MDELQQWLKQQNGGIRALTSHQQRVATPGDTDPVDATHYAFLSALAGQCVSSDDGALLLADVAEGTLRRLAFVAEAARKSIASATSGQLTRLNTIATAEL